LQVRHLGRAIVVSAKSTVPRMCPIHQAVFVLRLQSQTPSFPTVKAQKRRAFGCVVAAAC